MTTTAIKKQVDEYFPLLSTQQQTLVAEMMKSLLNVDSNLDRISQQEYNIEIDEAVARIENGVFVTQEDAIKELSV